MYNLFLDDIRHPKDVKWIELPLVDWIIVRNYKEFCAIIEKFGVPDMIALDHDLADCQYGLDWDRIGDDYSQVKEKTGYHCTQYLIGHCIRNNVKFPKHYIHTLNPVGKENMISLIDTAKNRFNI